MTMTKSERPFLPAAGHDLFLPIYDPLTKLLGMDRRRQALVEQAALAPRQRVLDVGCGTGSLAILIKEQYPTTDVVGLDPDPKALDRARRKAARAGLSIRFDRGFASALGYADQTFDRVVSSMMLHHLPDDDRLPALQEIKRVLKPGGRLELLDFGGPDGDLHGMAGRLVHSHRRLRSNAAAAVLRVMADAGFADARRVRTESTLFGRLEFYQGDRTRRFGQEPDRIGIGGARAGAVQMLRGRAGCRALGSRLAWCTRSLLRRIDAIGDRIAVER